MFTKEEIDFLKRVLQKLSFQVGGSKDIVLAESISKKLNDELKEKK